MEFTKVCLECGNIFESTKLYDDTLLCPQCECGDIDHINQENYCDRTLAEVEEIYEKCKIKCVCDGDKKEIIFEEE